MDPISLPVTGKPATTQLQKLYSSRCFSGLANIISIYEFLRPFGQNRHLPGIRQNDSHKGKMDRHLLYVL